MSHFGSGGMRATARRCSRLDYRVLVATVQAWQLTTATARAESRCGAMQLPSESEVPSALTRILLGGKDWQRAVLVQGGSFNPLFARCAGERQ